MGGILAGFFTRSDTPDPVRGFFVLVHGFASDRDEGGLFPLIERTLLEQGCGVLRYDARGLGLSDGAFECSTIDEHVDDFISVVGWLRREIGDAPIHGLGFSLGATIICLAARRGITLKSAVFLSPALRPCVDMWPRYNTPEIRKVLETNGCILKGRVRVGRAFLESLREIDLRDLPNEMQVPLLVCHGTADDRIPAATTRKIFSEARASSTRLKWFENASHSFRPEEVHRRPLIETIREWLPNGLTRSAAQPPRSRRQRRRPDHPVP